jgi:hypothetical protein
MIPLPVLEEIIDRSGIAPRIELLLPIGVRTRQLLVRTLLLGMLLALAGRRPAFLTEVHQALTRLPETDQRRLGVLAPWKTGPHLLTYRQTERTFGLAAAALAKDEPDGLPSRASPASATTCWRPASRMNSSTRAARWRWTGPTWRPFPARRTAAAATAPIPKRPGDTAPAAAPARTASCSSATTPPPPP